MKEYKFLVTGSNGLLGSDFCLYLSKDPLYSVIPTTRQNMDITDYKCVFDFILDSKPDLVIHTAAETNVDLCEKNPDHAFLVNTLSTKFIAIACEKLKIPLVFISTCGLFDGKKDSGYNEYDLPKPLTIYARSKYEAEKEIRLICTHHYIVRIGWLFGGNINHKKNFIAKRWLESKKNNNILSANDKFGSPTYSMDVARKIMEIMESGIYGTYHVANKGRCSRYEYVSAILKLLHSDAEVHPVDSTHFPRTAPVPDSEVIENYNLKLMDKDDMKFWYEALEEYISQRFLQEIG